MIRSKTVLPVGYILTTAAALRRDAACVTDSIIYTRIYVFLLLDEEKDVACGIFYDYIFLDGLMMGSL